MVVGAGGEQIPKITDKPYYVANQYNEGFGFVNLKIDGKRLDGEFYDISLNCQVEITEKKEKEEIDLKTCLLQHNNNDK